MKYGDDLRLVMAIDKNGLVGRGNGLPWNIKEDLAKFKDTTICLYYLNVIVMGFNTLASLNGRVLPDRANVVITSDHKKVEGLGYKVYLNPEVITDEENVVFVFNKVEDFLKLENTLDGQVFIIGGMGLVSYCIKNKYISSAVITIIDRDYGRKEGDVFFGANNFKYFNGGRVKTDHIVTSDGIHLNVYDMTVRV